MTKEEVSKIQPLEIEPQTKLMEEEVRTVKTKIQIRTAEPEVGLEPLVDVQVEITKTIVEEIDAQNIAKYIHFIFYHFPRILRTKSKI